MAGKFGYTKIYHNAKQFAKDVIGQERTRRILNMIKNNSSKNCGGGVTEKYRNGSEIQSVVDLCCTTYAQAVPLDFTAA